MPHLPCRRAGGRFSVPSDANRDLGIFLIFTGAVASVPLYYLYRVLVVHSADWDWRKGAALGGLVVLAGLWLMAFTRKEFRVLEHAIQVKDGFLRRAIPYTWKGSPQIRLGSLESEQNGRHVDLWQVALVDGKYEFLLDQRLNQHLESRCLAEFLAKSIGCPLIVRQDQGGLIQIAAEDLDLPFSERVHRYPSLLGPRLEKPEPCPVQVEEHGPQRTWSWGLTTTGVLSELVGLFLIVMAVTIVPLPGGQKELDYSLLQLSQARGDYAFYYLAGGLFVALLLLLFGYRGIVRLGPDQVTARTTLWGVPFWTRAIPTRHLEEISVRGRSQGAFLQLVSDERIINMRIVRQDVAEWLASDLRCAVAGGGGASQAPSPCRAAEAGAPA